MHMFRRALATAGVAALLVGTALAGTATAQGQAQGQAQGRGPGEGVTLACGSTVTHSVKLAADIGPCATTDGLIVTGSNIIVDLNGHTITGSHQNCPGSACMPDPHEQVGIYLNGASGDTVMNGTVAYFDGGVIVQGGSGNTVRRIDAHDNINSNVLTDNSLSAQNNCFYGDGIAVFSSNDNSILDNTTVHNGPYDGIAVVGIMVSGRFAPADNNLIQGNLSMNNYVADQTTTGGGTQCGGSKNAIYSGMGQGRQVQDMGIRIEGPGAAYNTVKENQVANNGLEGIAVFDYFCNLNGATKNGMPAGHEPANHNNTIVGNTVSGTGDATVQAASGQVDPSANGIAILSEGNPGVNCTAYDNTIAANTSVGNFQDGIWVGGMPSAPGHPQETTVVNNVVNDNTVDGLGVQAGAVGNVLTANAGHGNGEFDGADYNFDPSCGTDTWNRNRFTSVNQPCVADGGTGTVQKVIFDGANGIATGLQTTWSGLVDVTNPAGITIYGGADSTCSTPIATGTTPVAGNGTSSPTVSLSMLPPPGNAYFEIAANSVSAGPGVGNAAVGCTGVTFSGTPTPDTVTSVSVTGTIANPTFTVTGTGFGSTAPLPNPSTPPDGQQGCPASPTGNPALEGYLYGTNLYVVDNGPAGFDAGINSVTGEFDCVGLVVRSWSPTQVVLGFGDLYDQNIPGNDYVLANGDPIQVGVLGAVGSTTVSGLS